MQTKRPRLLLNLLLLSTFIGQLAIAHAQQFTLDWSTLDGGGGTSTGGQFSLTGGFGSLFSGVQTPGAPLLSSRLDTNHFVTIEWPKPGDGWTLERTSAFGTNAAATVWTPINPPYQTNATHIFLTTDAPAGHYYFRLRKP